MQETLHLLGNPTNADRLRQSIAEFKASKTFVKGLLKNGTAVSNCKVVWSSNGGKTACTGKSTSKLRQALSDAVEGRHQTSCSRPDCMPLQTARIQQYLCLFKCTPRLGDVVFGRHAS
ncbi:hypothetical protein [Mycetohabitans endofungorum]|uniref:type II toxin-antitoxin system Phd/YefM family antitoxin n=2 Tax=Burkholderiales TaxID=80840 RepID=UPI0030D3268D